MRNLVFVAVLLLGFCAVSVAQDVPQFEVFGGWSVVIPEEIVPQDVLNGWDASVVINANKLGGVEIDANGIYSGDEGSPKIHSFLFGPHIAIRKYEKFTPYVHALFGGTHVGYDDSIMNENGFSMAFGGGVDVKINKTFSIRPVQADFMTVRISGDFYNFARLSAGVVIKIGEF
jgi:hypothetical protein